MGKIEWEIEKKKGIWKNQIEKFKLVFDRSFIKWKASTGFGYKNARVIIMKGE